MTIWSSSGSFSIIVRSLSKSIDAFLLRHLVTGTGMYLFSVEEEGTLSVSQWIIKVTNIMHMEDLTPSFPDSYDKSYKTLDYREFS